MTGQGSGQRVPAGRTISASEISRNVKHFEAWSAHQGCDQVAYSDLPTEFRKDVLGIFDVEGRLPASWIDETSRSYRSLSKMSPNFHSFIRRAHASRPSLFSDEVVAELCDDLPIELGCVFLAWKQLRWMRRAKERWSEADFAANVYNVFRSPAVRESSHRTHCSLSLPRHLPHIEPNLAGLRVLRARTACPDGSIFIRTSAVRHLSLSKTSPYRTLNSHPSVKKACGLQADTAFRYQASPCAQPAQTSCFEFASSVWEDKKPAYELLESAYRQNRMGCTAVLRHLYSLHINAPVIGLLWADGKVKAHVDWWAKDDEHLVRDWRLPRALNALIDARAPLFCAFSQQSIFSAPFPGPEARVNTGEARTPSISAQSAPESTPDSESEFHEWDLEKPADILSVFLLIQNIDRWTAGRFRERVEEGVQKLVRTVCEDNQKYIPWKPEDTACKMKKAKPLQPTSSFSGVENTPPTSVSTVLLTPPPGPKRRVATKAPRRR